MENDKALSNLHKQTLYLFFGSISLSLLALMINQCVFHFHGMNYLKYYYDNCQIGLIILMLFVATQVSFYYFIKNERSYSLRILREYCYLFLVYGIIFFIATAAQYTPFFPIDHYLIELDKLIKFDLIETMRRVEHYPLVKLYLQYCYNFLDLELVGVFILVLYARDWHRLHAYYFMLLITAFLGFLIYYFFPTTGPASNLHSDFFTAEQYDVGKKFMQIHQNNPLSFYTLKLVAFPSFHTIWSILILFLIYNFKNLFYIILVINCSIILSTVLLGWHYLSDVLASFIVCGLSYFFYQKSMDKI